MGAVAAASGGSRKSASACSRDLDLHGLELVGWGGPGQDRPGEHELLRRRVVDLGQDVDWRGVRCRVWAVVEAHTGFLLRCLGRQLVAKVDVGHLDLGSGCGGLDVWNEREFSVSRLVWPLVEDCVDVPVRQLERGSGGRHGAHVEIYIDLVIDLVVGQREECFESGVHPRPLERLGRLMDTLEGAGDVFGRRNDERQPHA